MNFKMRPRLIKISALGLLGAVGFASVTSPLPITASEPRQPGVVKATTETTEQPHSAHDSKSVEERARILLRNRLNSVDDGAERLRILMELKSANHDADFLSIEAEKLLGNYFTSATHESTLSVIEDGDIRWIRNAGNPEYIYKDWPATVYRRVDMHKSAFEKHKSEIENSMRAVDIFSGGAVRFGVCDDALKYLALNARYRSARTRQPSCEYYGQIYESVLPEKILDAQMKLLNDSVVAALRVIPREECIRRLSDLIAKGQVGDEVDFSTYVAEGAMMLLIKVQGDAAIPVISKVAYDDKSAVRLRQTAVITLARLGTEKANDELRLIDSTKSLLPKEVGEVSDALQKHRKAQSGAPKTSSEKPRDAVPGTLESQVQTSKVQITPTQLRQRLASLEISRTSKVTQIQSLSKKLDDLKHEQKLRQIRNPNGFQSSVEGLIEQNLVTEISGSNISLQQIDQEIREINDQLR